MCPGNEDTDFARSWRTEHVSAEVTLLVGARGQPGHRPGTRTLCPSPCRGTATGGRGGWGASRHLQGPGVGSGAPGQVGGGQLGTQGPCSVSCSQNTALPSFVSRISREDFVRTKDFVPKHKLGGLSTYVIVGVSDDARTSSVKGACPPVRLSDQVAQSQLS